MLTDVTQKLPAPATDLTDGALARAVADQGPDAEVAEAELVRRFSRRVRLYGIRHLGDEARAEDLAQDVMALVLVRLREGAVREPERIGSFILGTARNRARDARRRGRREGEVFSRASLEQPQESAPREPIDRERLGALLAQLGERERTVVVLTFAEDRSAQEIGDALGLAPGHVRVIRHRAVARLAALLGVDEERT